MAQQESLSEEAPSPAKNSSISSTKTSLPRVPGHHRLRQLLPGPQRSGVHEHRRRARRPRHRRAGPRHHPLQPDRLPRWHAHHRPPSWSKTSEKAEDMLRFDLENENETIRNYRRRIKQCDELGEFATAEQIRQILLQEQDHQIAPRHRPRHRRSQRRHRRLKQLRSKGRRPAPYQPGAKPQITFSFITSHIDLAESFLHPRIIEIESKTKPGYPCRALSCSEFGPLTRPKSRWRPNLTRGRPCCIKEGKRRSLWAQKRE